MIASLAPGGRGAYYLPSFEAAARSFNLEPIVAPCRSDVDIESLITSLGRGQEGGFIVMPDNFTIVHRMAIISEAERNNVPGVYWTNIFPKDGGLLSYGPDWVDIFHRSASYVDRILRGAKPSELPFNCPSNSRWP